MVLYWFAVIFLCAAVVKPSKNLAPQISPVYFHRAPGCVYGPRVHQSSLLTWTQWTITTVPKLVEIIWHIQQGEHPGWTFAKGNSHQIKKKNIVYKPFVFLHPRQFVFALLPVEPASKKHQVTYIARGVVLVAGCCPLASRKAQLCLTKNLLSWFWSKATVCFLQREAFCAAVCPPLCAKTLHGFWQKKKMLLLLQHQISAGWPCRWFFKLSLKFPLPAFCHDLRDNDLFPQHSDRLNTSNLMRWIAGISDL